MCDFCGKGSLSGGHMRTHEIHCTANPKRICRMHKYFHEPQREMSELMAALNTKLADSGMAELRKRAADCPMCILSTILQSRIAKFDPECPPPELHFDFKQELASAWSNINDVRAYARENY